MARTIERRRALTVDARVRRLYLVVVALAGLEVALIAGLGVAFRHAAAGLDGSGASGPLIGAICGLAVLAALVALALAAHVTLETHRMAGSAFHLRRALQDLREARRPEPVTLRPGDYLEELAAEVNGLASRLGEPRAVAAEPAEAAEPASR